jgi:hypothetical protein
MFGSKTYATVAINLRPRSGSWGGANQWTSQLTRFLKYCGFAVRFDLTRRVDAIVMTHTGLSKGTSFGVEEVLRFKANYPQVPCIHRINDNDIRKGTTEMDAFLARSNEAADFTVFVSEWLRDHHAARWFNKNKPHGVIEAGADPAVFHPFGNRPYAGGPFRLVTHHWSDNWAKGFDVYQEIDRVIAEGLVKDFELWIIGRWPKEITWRAAKTFAPCSGEELASRLRECHGYVSASRHEPGAMHPVEGLQCGLPLLYHADSGGTVSPGKRYGVCIDKSLPQALEELRSRYQELRGRLLAEPPSGDLMSLSYRRLIQTLVCQGGAKS